MIFSIENRSPYLDHNLFEFCQTIPTKYLIQKGYAKVVLRQDPYGVEKFGCGDLRVACQKL